MRWVFAMTPTDLPHRRHLSCRRLFVNIALRHRLTVCAAAIGYLAFHFSGCSRPPDPIGVATGIAFLDEPGAKTIVSKAKHSKWYFDAIEGMASERVDLLNEQEGVLLPLVGVNELTVGAATVLAAHKGALVLDGLPELPTELAAELSKHEGVLSLNGIRVLGHDAASRLATTKGGLYLDGIVEIDPDTAEALSRHRYPLSLNGLKAPSPKAMEKLCSRTAATHMDGLESIDIKQAKALSSAQGLVFLAGLKRVPVRALEALRRNDKLFIAPDVVGVKE